MLFWLFVIILVVGVGLLVVGTICWDYKKHRFLYHYDDEIQTAGGWIFGISAFVLVVMIIVMCCHYFGIDAQLERNRERYTALNYKATSGACRDELGLLSKEVIDEVQDWNEDVRYYKTVQKNFWIGIFFPNVFDEFEVIEYQNYNGGK